MTDLSFMNQWHITDHEGLNDYIVHFRNIDISLFGFSRFALDLFEQLLYCKRRVAQ